ncbi:hypothetical protein [Mycetocola spongiae]|uniref:hypothetical protein n=1 Tax=Mycetocola spongiae TaxID=2859226 RepID=UPI001CF58755|nr:hypothetical protein [Mycetocola spongiae]UCR90030.1 hypothetical protein KXZ72_05020 [Mycetocola spongiae]
MPLKTGRGRRAHRAGFRVPAWLLATLVIAPLLIFQLAEFLGHGHVGLEQKLPLLGIDTVFWGLLLLIFAKGPEAGRRFRRS